MKNIYYAFKFSFKIFIDNYIPVFENKKIYFSFFIRNFLQKSARNTDKLKHNQTPRSKLYYIGFWILRLLHPRINLNPLINHGLFSLDKYEHLKIKRFIFQLLKDFFSRSQQADNREIKTYYSNQTPRGELFYLQFLILTLLHPRVNLNPLINHGLTPQSWDWWSSPEVRPPPSPPGRRGPSSPRWQPFLPLRPLSGSLSQGRQTWPLTSLPGTLIRKTYILFTF